MNKIEKEELDHDNFNQVLCGQKILFFVCFQMCKKSILHRWMNGLIFTSIWFRRSCREV